jgi:Holliday junction resolvasome RuvABC ATP-dependent DNA helicase subunit
MPEKMDDAFRSRFVMQLRIAPYTLEDMMKIVMYYSYGGCEDEASLSVFAAASAGNPRQARRIMDTARTLDDFDPEVVLSTVRVTADGATEEHIAYLELLSNHDKPLGVSYIATMLYIDEKTIKYLERLLTEMDLVQLTTSGRKLTGRGRAYVHLLEERGLI